jgi:hypothetical protein
LISRKNLSAEFAGTQEADYFPLRCRGDLFLESTLQGCTASGRTWPDHTRKKIMADVKAPQPLDPQDILKLLVALRRALKAGVA